MELLINLNWLMIIGSFETFPQYLNKKGVILYIKIGMYINLSSIVLSHTIFEKIKIRSKKFQEWYPNNEAIIRIS